MSPTSAKRKRENEDDLVVKKRLRTHSATVPFAQESASWTLPSAVSLTPHYDSVGVELDATQVAMDHADSSSCHTLSTFLRSCTRTLSMWITSQLDELLSASSGSNLTQQWNLQPHSAASPSLFGYCDGLGSVSEDDASEESCLHLVSCDCIETTVATTGSCRSDSTRRQRRLVLPTAPASYSAVW